ALAPLVEPARLMLNCRLTLLRIHNVGSRLFKRWAAASITAESGLARVYADDRYSTAQSASRAGRQRCAGTGENRLRQNSCFWFGNIAKTGYQSARPSGVSALPDAGISRSGV